MQTHSVDLAVITVSMTTMLLPAAVTILGESPIVLEANMVRYKHIFNIFARTMSYGDIKPVNFPSFLIAQLFHHILTPIPMLIT